MNAGCVVIESGLQKNSSPPLHTRRPSIDALREAHLLLYTLGSLDKDGDITALGRKMSSFPIEPKLAKVGNGGMDAEFCIGQVGRD